MTTLQYIFRSKSAGEQTRFRAECYAKGVTRSQLDTAVAKGTSSPRTRAVLAEITKVSAEDLFNARKSGQLDMYEF